MGMFSQSVRDGRTRFALSVIEGKLPCHAVELVVATPPGAKSVARAGENMLAHELRRETNAWSFSWPKP